MVFRLKDSLKHLQMKLSDFNKNLKLGMEQVKEIMPYSYYTEETIRKQLNPTEDFLDAVERQASKGHAKQDRQHVMTVLQQNPQFLCEDGAKVNIIEYCRFYCRRDCEVLQAGFLQWNSIITGALGEQYDLLQNNILTSSSLAHRFMCEQGVYD